MRDFPFVKIIQQALLLTKTKRFLWRFGLFLFLAEIPFVASLYRFQENEFIKGAFRQLQVQLSGKLILIVGILVSVLAGFVLLMMYFLSKAAIIQSVKNLTERKNVDYPKAIKGGRDHLWRLAGTSAAIWAGVLVAAAILFIPVIYLATSQSATRAAYLGFLAIVIFLPVLAVGFIISVISPMFIVLFGLKVNSSLKAAYDLLATNWTTIIMVGLVLRLVSLLVFFVSLFSMILIAVPVAFLSRLSYDIVGSAGVNAIYTVLGLVLVGVFLVIQSAVSAFNHTAWVLVFLEIVKPKKAQGAEEEAAVVPEMISGG